MQSTAPSKRVEIAPKTPDKPTKPAKPETSPPELNTLEQGLKHKASHIVNIARKQTRKAGLDQHISEDIAQEGKLGFILGWNEGERREAEHQKLKASERPKQGPTPKLDQAMFRANDRMNRAINKEQAQGRKIGLKTRADIKEDSEARREIEQATGEPATPEQIAKKTGKNVKLVYSTHQATQAQLKQTEEEKTASKPALSTELTPEESILQKELEEKINSALNKLDLFGDDKQFIARLFGLGGIKKESITVLAKEAKQDAEKTRIRRAQILISLQEDRDLKELIKKSQQIFYLFKSALDALSTDPRPARQLMINPIRYRLLRA